MINEPIGAENEAGIAAALQQMAAEMGGGEGGEEGMEGLEGAGGRAAICCG